MNHALAVDAANLDGGIEEQLLVHLPLRIEDAVSEARLQARCNRTVALVDLHVVLVVDEA